MAPRACLPALQGFAADFRGDQTDEELSNVVHTAISNIAHLKDHLRKWARNNQADVNLIDTAIANSQALRIVIDLANADKYGGTERDGGYSKLNPRISDIGRALRLKTRPVAGSMVAFTLSPDGTPKIMGDGSAAVEVSGRVVGEDGTAIGDLRDIVVEALAAWQTVLVAFRLSTDSSDEPQ